jgi:Glutathione S-transferase, N-terminal domain
MDEIILHHYPSSPFAEKVRIALGLKQLAWRSAHIPVLMPKPDLMPLTKAGPDAAPLSEFPALRGWMERVAQIGHGKPTELDSRQALDIARLASSQVLAESDLRDPLGRRPGVRVAVVPDDNGRDPVIGELVRSTREDIEIRRTDPQVGEVVVHFPRAGFLVQPAA